jgi:threonine/homoserine/homoserine lactone efflux protein
MDFSFFIKGLIIGFLLAAPVGPVGLHCIRRTILRGRLPGFVSGLGAACADTVYGCIAAFGLSFVSEFLVAHQIIFRIIGAVFICALGIKTFFSPPAEEVSDSSSESYIADFTATFFLTLMNPITIFAFTAVFTAIGTTNSTHTLEGLLVVGVFLGSALWWFLITTVAGLFHRKISHGNLLWLTRISGSIIIAFGLFIFISLLI